MISPRLTHTDTGKSWKRAAFLYPAAVLCEESSKLIVEVGPGRGDFLFHLATTNPDARIVGIEIKETRVDKLIARIEKRGLKNVRIIQDDARAAIPSFTQTSVDEIHINFPDPWPKRKHGKNRSVSAAFLAECCRVLKVDGTISIATDDESYAKEIARNAAKVAELSSCYPEIMIENTSPKFPTYFALKWMQMGRTLRYQKYFKHA